MRKYFSQNLVVSFCNVPSAIQFLRFKPKILILMIKHIRDPSSVHDCLLLVFFLIPSATKNQSATVYSPCQCVR